MNTNHTLHDSRRGRQVLSKQTEAAAVVRELRRLFKAIHQYSKAIHRRTGLSGPQVWALTLLRIEPGLSLGELSARMFAHPSTVSGVVERLVQRRALRRVRDSRDRRGIRIYLTVIGRRMLQSGPPPIQVGLRRSLLRMPETRLRLLRRSLGEIARETETERFEAPFFE